MFICSVAYQYLYSYTYQEVYTNIVISPTVEIYRVGDNIRTVNTSTVRIFNSDQLGAENVC